MVNALSSGNKLLYFQDCPRLNGSNFSARNILDWNYIRPLKYKTKYKGLPLLTIHDRATCSGNRINTNKYNTLIYLGKTKYLDLYIWGYYISQDHDSCRVVVKRNSLIFSPDFSRCDIFVDNLELDLKRHLIKTVFYLYHLIDRDCFILHSAAVKYKNSGLLFLGKSGAGKSTISRFFRDKNNAAVLNEDFNFVYRNKMGYFVRGVFGHPIGMLADFTIKTKIDYLFFLTKSKRLNLRKMGKSEALEKIFDCEVNKFLKVDLNFSKPFCDVFSFLVDFLNRNETYELEFRKSEDTVKFINSWLNKKIITRRLK